MLRFAIALLAAVAACGTAESADQALVAHRAHRAAARLPLGLPRPHYNFRTTITLAEPYVYPRPAPRLPLYAEPVLYAPVVYFDLPYIAPWAVAPAVDPYVPYWDRLPYACGVYGYC
jgi:hypothetical protein